MANIQVRTNGNQPTTTAPTREPFRMLRDLLRWDPFQEMMPLWPQATAELAPTFDIKETKDGYVFKADVPGIKDADLEVSVSGNRLTISGKREEEKEEKGDRYYACESSYGSFQRLFTLPEDADGASTQAELKDGVLTVAIHKTAQAQTKKIPIGTAKKS